MKIFSKNDKKKIYTVEEVKRKLEEELKNKPPQIGLIGISGVGKTSSINTFFKMNLPISHTKACTKEFSTSETKLKFSTGELKGEAISLRITDAPGLGEDITLDKKYLNMYRENLEFCDVILWVIGARNRGMALDQMYLNELEKFHPKIIFGINQVDIIEPMNWNTKINLPSHEIEKNISDIVNDRKEKISSVFKEKCVIVPYSASKGYNMEQIFYQIIKKIPKERRWIFSNMKNFYFKDFFKNIKNN